MNLLFISNTPIGDLIYLLYSVNCSKFIVCASLCVSFQLTMLATRWQK